MLVFETIDMFWQRCVLKNQNAYGFDTWTIGRLEVSAGDLHALLIEPVSECVQQVMVKQVADTDMSHLRQELQHRFVAQFAQRFGAFAISRQRGLAEYGSWQEFYDNWLVRGDQSVMGSNFPLLFDLSDNRLTVTTYMRTTAELYHFFIKNISKTAFADMQTAIQTALARQNGALYA